MSLETERIFRELNKAMQGQNFESEAEENEFISKFIEDYNQKVNLPLNDKKIDAYDYLEMAENAQTKSDAIKYAEKALKLDPHCLEADLLIAYAKSTDTESLKTNLEKVIKKGEKQLKEQGITKEADAGDFYILFETRPYMRARKSYLNLLLGQGKFKRAMEEAEELMVLCPNDNLGIRYILIALYCYFEDESKALELFKEYSSADAFMLLPLIALYYKQDDEKKMKSYIMKLKKSNPNLKKALKIIMDSEMSDDMIEDILSQKMYTQYSLEEIILAFSEATYLYMPMIDFLPKVYKLASMKT